MDWPAQLFTWWWMAYTMLLIAVVMACVSLTITALLLELVLGRRWSW